MKVELQTMKDAFEITKLLLERSIRVSVNSCRFWKIAEASQGLFKARFGLRVRSVHNKLHR